MEKQAQDFFFFFIADCVKEQKRLQQEERRDEADFEKIKANVYDIFRTVLSAAERKYDGDGSRAREFFAERLDQIPAAWDAALKKASAHGDVRAIHIESIKLAVVKDIRENIFQTGEEKR